MHEEADHGKGFSKPVFGDVGKEGVTSQNPIRPHTQPTQPPQSRLPAASRGDLRVGGVSPCTAPPYHEPLPIWTPSCGPRTDGTAASPSLGYPTHFTSTLGPSPTWAPALSYNCSGPVPSRSKYRNLGCGAAATGEERGSRPPCQRPWQCRRKSRNSCQGCKGGLRLKVRLRVVVLSLAR